MRKYPTPTNTASMGLSEHELHAYHVIAVTNGGTPETVKDFHLGSSCAIFWDGCQRAFAKLVGEKPGNRERSARIVKIAVVVAAVLVLALAAAGTVLALHWPFSQARVTQSLQEDFPASVTFEKFHSTFFPHPGCVGEGVAFRWLGSLPSTLPIVTIQRFTIRAHYIDIVLRPGYLSRIIMKGFHVYVPPPGTPHGPSNWQATKSTIRVDDVIADGASIEIARADGHAPLRFDISKMKLGSVSQNTAMSYKVALHNPLPPGEIRGQGQFGPWNSDAPGQTPVRGKYTFQNADLGVFSGIAGMLSAEGTFQGILGRIESQGSIDIPDFMVTRSKHSVHVAASFNGSVNGINGDVQLESVTAAFLKTQVLASGEIAGHAGQHGKTASIDMTVHDGRIQDVLGLFVSGPKPPLDGVTSFRARVVIPPGKEPFVQKVRLSADFGIESGQFAQTSTQENVDELSNQSRGLKPHERAEDEDPERVISNFAGHVELRDATAAFANASFEVPGAFARMHGTYNLQSEVVDLHGTLKTEAELSKMTSGFKSALLKPFNIFFKRKRAGAVVPVRLIGTYKHAQAGLDLP